MDGDGGGGLLVDSAAGAAGWVAGAGAGAGAGLRWRLGGFGGGFVICPSNPPTTVLNAHTAASNELRVGLARACAKSLWNATSASIGGVCGRARAWT